MVVFQAVEWDDAADPGGNVRHVAAHGLTPEEVEEVLDDPNGSDDVSRSSGRPVRFGRTSTGKFVMVAYEVKRGRTITVVRPITAYEVRPRA